MKTKSLEFSVGVFVLVGLLCVAYLTVKLGKMEMFAGPSYTLTAHFRTVAGLKVNALVDLAGVGIGRVDSIELDKEEMLAVVRLRIRADVPVAEDAIASIKTSGLIGDRYVRISPGGSETRLRDGERILETESAVDLEEIIGKYAFGKV